MTSRDLFNLEHGAWTLEEGDTGVALLDKVNDMDAPRTTASPPEGNGAVQGASPIVPDVRVRKLVALSRWERAGMLAYVAATFPDAFDEAYAALGLAET